MMGGDRRGDLVRHLSEKELDHLLRLADDPKIIKRFTFVKRLYKGATYEEAADDVVVLDREFTQCNGDQELVLRMAWHRGHWPRNRI